MTSAQETTELLAIWRSVLKNPALDEDSNFFGSGGDSLLAIELATEIERRLGHDVQPGIVFHFNTPRRFARWLEEGGPRDAPLLTPELTPDSVGLVGDGPGTPVFFVPGLGGFGLMPKPLAEVLAGRHPYFDRLIFAPVRPDTSIQEIARGLIPQVRLVCPQGPYIFMGYSFGGCVAYELARQLKEAGETVEHVVLWDAYSIVSVERRSALGVSVKLLGLALSPARWGNRSWLTNKFTNFRKRMRVHHEEANGASTRERGPGNTAPDAGRQNKPFTASLQTLEVFRPLPYTGRVSLLACEEEDDTWVFERYVEDHNTWNGAVPADCLSVIKMPCTHLEMLREPHIESCIRKTMEIIG